MADLTANMSDMDAAVDIRNALVGVQTGDNSHATWDKIRGEIDNYQKQFGVTPQTTGTLVNLRKLELLTARKFPDPSRFKQLAAQLERDPNPDIAQMAKDEVAGQDRIDSLKSKPFELKFTDTDGKTVDFAALRGKVVMLYFWASWEAPCMNEAPILSDLYTKYQPKGFEIIGISLDTDEPTMKDFVTQLNEPWPQYYDGKKWDNAISSAYGIKAVPTRWLFNKKGFLVDTNASGDLEAEVQKYLNEP